jgi:hypothetical protein
MPPISSFIRSKVYDATVIPVRASTYWVISPGMTSATLWDGTRQMGEARLNGHDRVNDRTLQTFLEADASGVTYAIAEQTGQQAGQSFAIVFRSELAGRVFCMDRHPLSQVVWYDVGKGRSITPIAPELDRMSAMAMDLSSLDATRPRDGRTAFTNMPSLCKPSPNLAIADVNPAICEASGADVWRLRYSSAAFVNNAYRQFLVSYLLYPTQPQAKFMLESVEPVVSGWNRQAAIRRGRWQGDWNGWTRNTGNRITLSGEDVLLSSSITPRGINDRYRLGMSNVTVWTQKAEQVADRWYYFISPEAIHGISEAELHSRCRSNIPSEIEARRRHDAVIQANMHLTARNPFAVSSSLPRSNFTMFDEFVDMEPAAVAAIVNNRFTGNEVFTSGIPVADLSLSGTGQISAASLEEVVQREILRQSQELQRRTGSRERPADPPARRSEDDRPAGRQIDL